MKRINTFEHAMQSVKAKKCGSGSKAFYLISTPKDDRIPAGIFLKVQTYTEAQSTRRTIAGFLSN